MPKETVDKCHTWFTLIIFHALEARNHGGGEQGLLFAGETLKNINATAMFGNFN